MKIDLHLGHALAGLFLLVAFSASGRPPEPALALRAVADGSVLPPPAAVAARLPDPGSLAGYLAANPACREVSNSCEICVRGAGDRASCSTPGIACLPTGWTCSGSAENVTGAPLAPAQSPPPPLRK